MDGLRAYILGCYWSISTISTVGFGDIRATNNQEKALSIGLIACGVWFYSQSIGILSSILISEEAVKLANKFTIIEEMRKCTDSHFHAPKFVDSIQATAAQTFKLADDCYDISCNLAPMYNLFLSTSMIGEMKDNNLFFKNKNSEFISNIVPYLNP